MLIQLPPKKTAAAAEKLVPLQSILHFMARRNEFDEGFVVHTQSMSTSHMQYSTTEALVPGEVLRLKIVAGLHVVDTHCVVESQHRQLRFLNLSDRDRRLIGNIVQRYGSLTA